MNELKVDQFMPEQPECLICRAGSAEKEEGGGMFAAALDKALAGKAGESETETEALSGDPERAEKKENEKQHPEYSTGVKPHHEHGGHEKYPGAVSINFRQADSEALLKGKPAEEGQDGREKVEKTPASPAKSERVPVAFAGKAASGVDPVPEGLVREADRTGTESKMKNHKEQSDMKNEIPGSIPEKAAELPGAVSLQKEQAAGKEPFEKDVKKPASGERAEKAAKPIAEPLKAETLSGRDGKKAPAEKTADQSAGRQPERISERQRSDIPEFSKTVEQQKTAAKKAEIPVVPSGLADRETAVNAVRAEGARPQPVTSAPEQSPAFDQLPVKGDQGLHSIRVPNSRLPNLKENVMQQLEGRMVYLRETGGNPAEMRLTLHPPELGEITVRVFSRQGKLSASIVTETALVREILESSITELRQRMNLVSIDFEQLDLATADKESGGSDRPGDRHYPGNPEHADSEGKAIVDQESGMLPDHGAPDSLNRSIDFWA